MTSRAAASPSRPPDPQRRDPPPDPSEIRRRDQRAGRDFLFGLAVTVAILLLELLWQHRPLVEWVHDKTQEYLQQFWLSSPRQDPDLPIAILDISDLEGPSPAQPRSEAQATPRDKLWALIQAVAAQHPLAIGLDIDFSPTESGYAGGTADPGFFGHCLDLRDQQQIPVYLGVFETMTRPPGEWLGVPEFQRLAAAVAVPDAGGTWRMPQWVRGDGLPQKLQCPSMAAALADQYRGARRLPPIHGFWPLWQLTETRHEPGTTTNPGYDMGEFLVDYSCLKQLRSSRTTLKASSAAQVLLDARRFPGRFRKKLILIGDGTRGQALDTFRVANEPEPIPGVFVQACAAYTLARAPLYEWTPLGRLAVDLALSIGALLLILRIRRYYHRISTREVREDLLHRFFFKDVAVLLVFGAGLLVCWTRIVWDDAPIVALALWIHPTAHSAVELCGVWGARSGRWARRTAPAAYRRLSTASRNTWARARTWLDDQLLTETEKTDHAPNSDAPPADGDRDDLRRSA